MMAARLDGLGMGAAAGLRGRRKSWRIAVGAQEMVTEIRAGCGPGIAMGAKDGRSNNSRRRKCSRKATRIMFDGRERAIELYG